MTLAGWGLTVVLAVPGLAAAPGPLPHLTPGTVAPDFTVERLVGGTLQLSALRGRVVLIDFWATWCPPCRAELPWLLKLAQLNESRGLFFLAMNQDEGPQRLLAGNFANELDGIARFITLGGPAVGAPFHVDGLPTLYVIDRQGRVFASAEGRLTEASVAALLERALAR